MTTCPRAGGCAGSHYPFLTHKERDNETGLDYFINRYYSSTQGRFTSADPIPMTSMRPFDPQQLNLYVYVRNNPLLYNDPYGLDLFATGSEADKLRKDLEKASGLRLQRDEKTGKITVKGKVPENLSETGQQILNIIQDPNNIVRVEATRDRDDVNVGLFKGNGEQVIDYADIDQLSKAGKGGLDGGGAVVHEVTEAYAGVTNRDPTKNFKNSFHPTGIYYENLVRKSKGLGPKNESGQLENTFGNETFVTVDYTTHYEHYTLVRTGPGTYKIKDVKVEKKK